MKTTVLKITAPSALNDVEKRYRRATEYISLARNTSYSELTSTVFPDRGGEMVCGYFSTPVILYFSQHEPHIGILELCRKTFEFLTNEFNDTDILSISAEPRSGRLELAVLVRPYDEPGHFDKIYSFLGETAKKDEKDDVVPSASRITATQKLQLSPQETERRDAALKKQEQMYEEDEPFLNCIDNYEIKYPDIKEEEYYNLEEKYRSVKTLTSYEMFMRVFVQTMQYITQVEKVNYYAIMEGGDKTVFENVIDAYLQKTHVETGNLCREDLDTLKAKLDNALFGFYLIQDLIDDPEITDIKITAPDAIRVRIHGKAYLSNVTFIDEEDYQRFISGLALKNNIDLNLPTQTFTDQHESSYILRFSITAPYITCTGFPILHVRKLSRNKPLEKELIAAGMFDEKIMKYLLDRGKEEGGIVFAGPPGSGKTTILNWFLERAYESSAEILVIQENDELFTYRKGVMFEHVVNNPVGQEQKCTLEQLGEMALVAGANVFVIGEAKGSEICSAITLANSGCRTAITIHSPSADKTVEKMADLAMRGHAESYAQAKRMLSIFKTIVYLQDFKVKEISEIVGYDEEKKDIKLKKIYIEDYKRD